MSAEFENVAMADALFDWVTIGEVMMGSHQTPYGMRETVSGDVFNTSQMLADLGQRVAFYTAIGHDAATPRIQTAIQDAKLFEHFVFTHPQRPNGYYLTRDGMTSYERHQSAATMLVSEFALSIGPLLKTTRGLFLSGVTMAVCVDSLPYFVALFKAAREAGVTTAFDPNYRAELWRSPEHAWAVMSELLPYTDIFLPSLADMKALLRVSSPNAVLETLKKYELPMIALTLGAQGAQVNSHQLQWQADVRRVYPDAWMLGAGDAFNGGFLAAWSEGDSIDSALKRGIDATENAFFLGVMNERPDPLDNPSQFFETDELAYAM